MMFRQICGPALCVCGGGGGGACAVHVFLHLTAIDDSREEPEILRENEMQIQVDWTHSTPRLSANLGRSESKPRRVPVSDGHATCFSNRSRVLFLRSLRVESSPGLGNYLLLAGGRGGGLDLFSFFVETVNNSR